MIFRKATLLLLLFSLFVVVSRSQAQPTITTMTLQNLNPTNDTTLGWRITFDQPVTGVSTSNFTLAPTGVTATLDSVTSAPGNQSWFVTATGVSGNGTLGADLSNPAGIMGTTAPLTETITGPLYDVDNISPQVISITRLDPSPTGATTVNFAITFSEPVVGLSTINLSSGGTLTGTDGDIATTDSITWTASLSNISGSGTIKLDLTDTTGITDIAGNSLFSDFTAGETYIIDQQGPALVCITRLDPTPTSSTSVRFLVEFDQPTSGVQTSNFTVNAGGTTTGTITSVVSVGDGTTWTLTVSNIEGAGLLTVDLTDPTGITDLFGNPTNTTGSGCEQYAIDRQGPEVISIDLPNDSPTSATTLEFLVTFSEPVTSGTLDDFSLIANGNSTGTITSVTTSGSLTTVTVTGVSGPGSLCLQVDAPSTITDLMGNPLINIPVTSGCYIICQQYSQVTNIFPQEGDTVTPDADDLIWSAPAPALTYIVYFDGSIIGTTTDTLFAIPKPLTPGEHNYMIDIEGACTSGTLVTFFVLDVPTLIFPTNNFESCLPPTAFSWDAVDGATLYTLFIDGVAITSTTATMAVVDPPPAIGTHTWYIVAESAFTTQQSATWTFTVLPEDRNAPLLYTTNGTVHDIEVVGSTTYIAGEFTLVKSGNDWVERDNIASVNTGSAIVQDWKPEVNGAVYTLKATTTTLLLGGNFTQIADEPIARIASLDFGTTTAGTFRPGANGPVRAIEVVGDTVYFGGDFDRVNSQVFNFANPGDEAIRLAAADISGSPAISTGLNPNASVRDLLYDGTHMYVAGVFSSIGGQAYHGLTRFDPAGTPAVPDPDFVDLSAQPSSAPVDLYVYTMAKTGNTLFIGGSFNEVLGEDRPNAAALQVGDTGTTTSVLPWNPRPNAAVHSIDVAGNGSMVYLGGAFTTLNNARSTYLVAVDPVAGNPMTCSFNGDRLIYAVEAIMITGSVERVAAGGQATITGRDVPTP